jgi:hypothetical protein
MNRESLFSFLYRAARNALVTAIHYLDRWENHVRSGTTKGGSA